MKRVRDLMGILVAGVSLVGLAADPPGIKDDLGRFTKDVARRHAAIKPRPEEVKWRRIPWLIDLDKGIEAAKKEGRPLLIWTSQQSHPLERC